MKHTPGQWTATEPNGRGMGWRAGPAWLGMDAGSETTAANAYLIAAAPDLLFHLLAAADYIDALGGDSKSYRAVIAKATKKTDLSKTWNPGPPPSIGWWPASVRQNHQRLRWWDGKFWSQDVGISASASEAAYWAKQRSIKQCVEWTKRPSSWPARSRT